MEKSFVFVTYLKNLNSGFSVRGEWTAVEKEKKKKRRRNAGITKYLAKLSCWIEIQEICGAVNNYQVSDRHRVAAVVSCVPFTICRVRDVFHDLQSQFLWISIGKSSQHAVSIVIRVRDSLAPTRQFQRNGCRMSPPRKSDSANAEICFRGSFSFSNKKSCYRKVSFYFRGVLYLFILCVVDWARSDCETEWRAAPR